MVGTIPQYLEQFTLLENLAINDHCLTGPIPQGLLELPLNPYVALYNNAYGLSGDLEAACDANSTSPAYREGVKGIFIDNSVDCSCCVRCRPNDYQCDDIIWNVTWPSANTEDATSRDSKGNQIQFSKDCNTPAQIEWIEENCPCTVEFTDEKGNVKRKCDDCSGPGALMSTGN